MIWGGREGSEREDCTGQRSFTGRGGSEEVGVVGWQTVRFSCERGSSMTGDLGLAARW